MPQIPHRYLFKRIVSDLRKKMVFISGPRQVGKTTLAKTIGSSTYKHATYLNWDNAEHRKRIVKQQFSADTDVLVLDEIHKYKKWKNYTKGIFDVRKQDFNIMVTGSARLDIYNRGGDSLTGRYFKYRLHPFSLAELLGQSFVGRVGSKLELPKAHKDAQSILQRLEERSGFPEPLYGTQRDTLRWHNERLDRLIAEDIRDVESVRDLSALHVLADMLPEKVGSLFSVNSLLSDIEVTHKTARHWIDIFERFYYHFRIYPYTLSKKSRYLKKEPKLYLWDWTSVKSQGARFENVIALHLLKFAQYIEDTTGHRIEVRFIRDRDGNEIDFVVLADGAPWFGVETKVSDTTVSAATARMQKEFNIPTLYQAVRTSGVDFVHKGVHVVSADRFLAALV